MDVIQENRLISALHQLCRRAAVLAAQPERLFLDHRIELKLRGIGQLLNKAYLQLVFVGFGFYRQVHPSQLVAAGFTRPEHFQNPAFIRQSLRKLPLRGAVHQVDRLVNI